LSEEQAGEQICAQGGIDDFAVDPVGADGETKSPRCSEQADQSVTRQFGGLGLGLAISKALIDLHGGKLTATSAGANRGSTFTLEMRPTAATAAECDNGDAPPAANPKGRPTGAVAIVNETFARVYFDGRSPVGRTVVVDSLSAPMEIVGMAADAVYFSVREAMHPAVFVPLAARDGATVLVRTAAGAGDLRPVLRREIPRIQPGVTARDVAPFEARGCR
jgi:hypothetical protein